MSEISPQLQALVRDEEQVRWRAKPDRRAFAAGWCLAVAITAGMFASIGAVGLVLEHGAGTPSVLASTVSGQGPLLAGAGLGLAVVAAVALHRAWTLAEHVITDERIIKASGVVGRDVSTVRLDDVTDVDVQRSLVGRLFGTGGLAVQTAGGAASGLTLPCVRGPYEVLGLIQATGDQPAEATRADRARV